MAKSAPILMTEGFANACADRINDERLIDQICRCVEQLSRDPRHPGLNTEVLYTESAIGVYSARINRQFRLILARTAGDQLYLLYADNHKEAYDWAHEARQRIARLIRQATPWQDRLQLAQAHPRLPRLDIDQPIPIAHVKALRRMLREGMHPYLAYLDKAQQSQATFDFTQRSGLMFVTGGAGTGKTAIAIHRALHLAREPELDRQGVLYLCFSRFLSNVVRETIEKLAPASLRQPIQVKTFAQWCGEYLSKRDFSVDIPPDSEAKLVALIRKSRQARSLEGAPTGITDYEIAQEIKSLKIIGCQELRAYWNLERVGRVFGLRQAQRTAIW